MLLPTGRATSSSLYQKHSISFRSTSQSPPRVRSFDFSGTVGLFSLPMAGLSSTSISQWFGATTSLRWSFVTVTRKGLSVSRSPTAISRSLSKYPLQPLASEERVFYSGISHSCLPTERGSRDRKHRPVLQSALRVSDALYLGGHVSAMASRHRSHSRLQVERKKVPYHGPPR